MSSFTLTSFFSFSLSVLILVAARFPYLKCCVISYMYHKSMSGYFSQPLFPDLFLLQEKQRVTDKLEDTSLRLKDEMDLYRKIMDKLWQNRHEFQKEKESMQEVRHSSQAIISMKITSFPAVVTR